MRIDHFSINELDAFEIEDQIMSILIDIQESVKEEIEKKSNVIETFYIPFRKTIEEFIEKKAKELKEKKLTYEEALNNETVVKFIIDTSLGEKKTERKVTLFEEHFNIYKKLIQEKKKQEEEEKKLNLNSLITDEKVIEKIKDIIEFVYIYRFNKKDTEKVLNFLNDVYNKKYGGNFLQKNMTIYQIVESEIEDLINIENKVAYIKEMIESKDYKTIKIFTIFYWFYARGEIENLTYFLKEKEMMTYFRDYIIELIIKRSNLKAESEKIKESVKKSKEAIKEIVNKLNTREFGIISRNIFDKLMIEGAKHLPDYFNRKVAERLRESIYNYIKSEKLKDAK
ncbi:MAG TPA: hypothetical protein PKW55_04720 [Spirochaetota bacterium]|nr:hypothetical protein [Spirochaetota bacterium]HOM37858.1 hypothetical protein [Spirochaetota bacterium]HPQ48662.1 hypothetical protein [Spirochaetota bacterium]